jgi:arylsulfatase A-like enzyme
MVTAMDDAVGEIVQTLRDAGLYDDTVIVFSSDVSDLTEDHTSSVTNLT